MKGDGVAPARTESANAANFPLLGGILRPEEIAQGHIDHALAFMMPGVSNLGHVCPATHHDGDSSDPNALMEGMRIQLDPSIAVGSLPLPGWQKTIARALQVYGASSATTAARLRSWPRTRSRVARRLGEGGPRRKPQAGRDSLESLPGARTGQAGALLTAYVRRYARVRR